MTVELKVFDSLVVEYLRNEREIMRLEMIAAAKNADQPHEPENLKDHHRNLEALERVLVYFTGAVNG